MHGEIATTVQDGDIFAGKGPTIERVDLAIFSLLGHRRRCLVALELGQGRVVHVAIAVLVHVGEVRVVLGVAGIHLLALGSRTVCWVSSVSHSDVWKLRVVNGKNSGGR